MKSKQLQIYTDQLLYY